MADVTITVKVDMGALEADIREVVRAHVMKGLSL